MTVTYRCPLVVAALLVNTSSWWPTAPGRTWQPVTDALIVGMRG